MEKNFYNDEKKISIFHMGRQTCITYLKSWEFGFKEEEEKEF